MNDVCSCSSSYTPARVNPAISFGRSLPVSGTSTRSASSNPEYTTGFWPIVCSHSNERSVP
jgi:hypothetical protein